MSLCCTPLSVIKLYHWVSHFKEFTGFVSTNTASYFSFIFLKLYIQVIICSLSPNKPKISLLRNWMLVATSKFLWLFSPPHNNLKCSQVFSRADVSVQRQFHGTQWLSMGFWWTAGAKIALMVNLSRKGRGENILKAWKFCPMTFSEIDIYTRLKLG